jgi:hypothetical protein
MADARIETTPNIGLTALVGSAPASRGWSFAYQDPYKLDSIIHALHEATRDGTQRIADPSASPTIAIAANGFLWAGMTLEIKQSFVDEWGRETAASPVASIATNDPIPEPTVAPSVASVSGSNQNGFDFGTLNVWYTYCDAHNGETLASPVTTIELPALVSPNKNQITVVIPHSDDMDSFASSVKIYAQWRSGNINLAKTVFAGSWTPGANLDTTIDKVAEDCYPVLPTYNSTNKNQSLEITGIAAPTNSVSTRFYIKEFETDWVSGAFRLYLEGTSDFDVATVIYPLIYTGVAAERVSGIPLDKSEIIAIRPIDYETEIINKNIAELLGSAAHGGITNAQDTPAMSVQVTALIMSDGVDRILSVAENLDVTIATADTTDDRYDIVCVNPAGIIVSSGNDVSCTGTPAVSPVRPATPSGYILLASVLVAANATEITTNNVAIRQWSVYNTTPGSQSIQMVPKIEQLSALAGLIGYGTVGNCYTNSTTPASMSVAVVSCIYSNGDGFFGSVPTVSALTIAAADVTNPRIDLVCINPFTNTYVSSGDDPNLKGIPDVAPVAKDLYDDLYGKYRYYITVAEVTVDANATAIHWADIAQSYLTNPTIDRPPYTRPTNHTLSVPGLSMVPGSSGVPDKVNFAGTLLAYAFDGAGGTEQLYFTVDLPQEWVALDYITWKVVWAPTDTNTGDVVWKMDYIWGNIGEVLDTPEYAVADPQAAGGVSLESRSAGYIDLEGTFTRERNSSLICRLYRDSTDGSDTYEHDALLISCQFNISVYNWGSNTY